MVVRLEEIELEDWGVFLIHGIEVLDDVLHMLCIQLLGLLPPYVGFVDDSPLLQRSMLAEEPVGIGIHEPLVHGGMGVLEDMISILLLASNWGKDSLHDRATAVWRIKTFIS